jgi:hypothetical protein
VLTCEDLIGLLLDYLEGSLEMDVEARLTHHLDGCAPCRAYLGTYERTRDLTAEATRVEMPAAVKASLRQLLVGQLRPGAS